MPVEKNEGDRFRENAFDDRRKAAQKVPSTCIPCVQKTNTIFDTKASKFGSLVSPIGTFVLLNLKIINAFNQSFHLQREEETGNSELDASTDEDEMNGNNASEKGSIDGSIDDLSSNSVSTHNDDSDMSIEED